MVYARRMDLNKMYHETVALIQSFLKKCKVDSGEAALERLISIGLNFEMAGITPSGADGKYTVENVVEAAMLVQLDTDGEEGGDAESAGGSSMMDTLVSKRKEQNQRIMRAISAADLRDMFEFMNTDDYTSQLNNGAKSFFIFMEKHGYPGWSDKGWSGEDVYKKWMNIEQHYDALKSRFFSPEEGYQIMPSHATRFVSVYAIGSEEMRPMVGMPKGTRKTAVLSHGAAATARTVVSNIFRHDCQPSFEPLRRFTVLTSGLATF